MPDLVKLLVPIDPPKVKGLPANPSDTIVPLYPLDDDWISRNDTLLLCFRFDAVLSPIKLKTALEELISTGDYRKLGARLRVNKDRKVEYHIPRTFDDERPACHFTHMDFSAQPIEQHPLGAKMPKATATPTVQTSIEELLPIFCDRKGPHYLKDWLSGDEPVLSLHVTSFQDATLVSFQWPHTVMDMIGSSSFLKAYIDVLNGQKDKLPSVIGFDQDPVAAIAKPASRPSKSARPDVLRFEVKGWKLLRLMASVVYEDHLRGKLRTPTVCFPGAAVAAFREHALLELKAKHGKDVFVSEDDIVTALLLKAYTADLSPKSKRPVAYLTATGLRHRRKDIFTPNSFYQGNAVLCAVHCFKSQREIKEMSITELAYAYRQELARQMAKDQVEALAHTFYHGILTKDYIPIMALPYARFILASSFSACKFYRTVDFAAAARTDDSPLAAPLLPSLVLAHKFCQMPTTWNSRVLGKDHSGNIWLRLFVPSKALKHVERGLQDLHAQGLALLEKGQTKQG